MDNTEKMELARREMVNSQLRKRGIKDNDVLSAFMTVPRHMFVPEDKQDMAYWDGPLPIGEEQTISQPYIVAEMIEAMNLNKSDCVLEIGTGSGYAAAILSRIVNRVYSIERYPTLARKAEKIFQTLDYTNIEIKIGDGTEGWKEKAPFAGIIVSAAAPGIPESLLRQLKVKGYLVLPVGDKSIQELWQIRKEENDDYSKKSLGMVRFVPLVGKEGWKEV